MKIVDTHSHYGTVSDTPFMSASFEEVVEVSRKAGITANVFLGRVESAVDPSRGGERKNLDIDLIMRINEEVLDRTSREPDCYMCCVLNPLHARSFEQTEELLREPGCVGVKILARYHGYDVEVLGDEIFSFLADQDAPAMFHSIENGFDDPPKIAYLAAKYPTVKACMAHMYSCGAPIALTHARLIRTCASTSLYAGLEHPYMAFYSIIEHTVREICGSDRLMYGSDLPCHVPAAQLAAIEQADIADADKANILFRNAERFFGQEF
ncbi:MAG: amidohydrolase family protein [Dehalococcoidia bacterium]|nr:amidohydrolase family protein [Dehalococcoidia bacterium]